MLLFRTFDYPEKLSLLNNSPTMFTRYDLNNKFGFLSSPSSEVNPVSYTLYNMRKGLSLLEAASSRLSGISRQPPPSVDGGITMAGITIYSSRSPLSPPIPIVNNALEHRNGILRNHKFQLQLPCFAHSVG